MTVLKRRYLIISVVAILVTAIILSSFVYLSFQKSYAGKVETLTIGQLPNETESLIYIANDQKYFADNGIDITFKNYASGAAATAGVLNNEVNIGVATEFIVAEEALNNASLCTFATESKFLSFYVVARTDKGIQNISDLNGKTIGVAFGTIGEFYLGNFFEQYGLDSSNMTLVNVPLAGAQNALVNGTVNAVITLQPYVSQIESSLGNKVMAWSAQSNQDAYSDLVCANSWAQQNPDLIVRFLKSLLQAEGFVQEHQSQAIVIVTNTLNYSITYLPTVWSNYQFTVSLDQSQILAMQNEAQWLINNNLTNATSTPNFLNYFYFNGLTQIDHQAVTIIH
ncbi:MAG TPA: NrtA/SsuA/CpmA family ABC transporter substrate-binding protein [Candidatus Nanoarchaeia archaeon]|nr:NrtA/SsuA/CpmA family ABC transporter substrate-binding protein [Candidatus Nanoarchaeia archaeon]